MNKLNAASIVGGLVNSDRERQINDFKENKDMKFSDILISKSDIERFWKKVDINIYSNDKCWEWNASINKSGYGAFRIGGKKGKIIMSHRFSAFLSHDIFYPEMQYLHSCDNPICCNPYHLRAGTKKENMMDMSLRKRNNTSRAGNGYTKIDSDKKNKIISMKIDGKNNCEIARFMGISDTRVYQIYNEYINNKA